MSRMNSCPAFLCESCQCEELVILKRVGRWVVAECHDCLRLLVIKTDDGAADLAKGGKLVEIGGRL